MMRRAHFTPQHDYSRQAYECVLDAAGEPLEENIEPYAAGARLFSPPTGIKPRRDASIHAIAPKKAAERMPLLQR